MIPRIGGVWIDGDTIKHRRGDSGVLVLLTWWPKRNTTVLLREGLTAKLTVKKRWQDTSNVFQLELSEDGGFVFEPELTKDLKPGTYCYDVEVTVDGTVKTIAVGKYKLLPDVTRRVENEEL